ncbi:hypothetical protein BC834DRAFT_193026 [Gloeopeniophorella convolvens]|nr:hypothetical protein BC834DRAFT_193026 [Gloeopeniophorella convolvens]
MPIPATSCQVQYRAYLAHCGSTQQIRNEVSTCQMPRRLTPQTAKSRFKARECHGSTALAKDSSGRAIPFATPIEMLHRKLPCEPRAPRGRNLVSAYVPTTDSKVGTCLDKFLIRERPPWQAMAKQGYIHRRKSALVAWMDPETIHGWCPGIPTSRRPVWPTICMLC